jgi:hypothetical protein
MKKARLYIIGLLLLGSVATQMHAADERVQQLRACYVRKVVFGIATLTTIGTAQLMRTCRPKEWIGFFWGPAFGAQLFLAGGALVDPEWSADRALRSVFIGAATGLVATIQLLPLIKSGYYAQ